MQRGLYLNLSICACVCDKDCEIDKHFKNFTSMKSLIGYSVIMRDEIAGTAETTILLINKNIQNGLLSFSHFFISSYLDIFFCFA